MRNPLRKKPTADELFEGLRAAERDHAHALVELKRAEESVGATEEEDGAAALREVAARKRVQRCERELNEARRVYQEAAEREADVAETEEAAAMRERISELVGSAMAARSTLKVKRLELANLVGRLGSPSLRAKLAEDPTRGLRPEIVRLVGDLIPIPIRDVLASSQPLPIGGTALPRTAEAEYVRTDKEQAVRRGVIHHGIRPGHPEDVTAALPSSDRRIEP